jgi:predicted metal-dependent hydrolase
MGQTEQLDLFFDGPGVPFAAPSAPPSARGHPAVPTIRPPSLPQNARWREVQAPQQTIGYILQRSRRKSIGLTINDDGLQVTAPNWVTLGQIDAAVLDKAPWILAKLKTRQARQQHLATVDTQWREGGRIPYLGTYVVLALDGTQTLPAFSGMPLAPQEGDILRLALPVDAERSRVRDSVHAWLQQQASLLFAQRLQHFLDANGLKVRRWRLSSAATRWGSCSSDGNIMLNWRLIHFSHDIIDYVIAHEVAHLREMNHGREFWREVGRILPGFEKPRNALRQYDPGSLPLL